jgi:MerR family redox-sensitive transcriptional activator SoxR
VDDELSIGAVADRTGVATSALRYYEDEGLISADRNQAGHRRYRRAVIRRVSFIQFAQRVGLSLEEIRNTLAMLPDNITPSDEDWERLSQSWRPRLDEHIATLERLRDRLEGCIGCGCLSMSHCKILNPSDEVFERGPGPRYVIDSS